MSIADRISALNAELSRIASAKDAIRAAIEAKGVTVPAGALLGDFAGYIEAIEGSTSGGGGDTGSGSAKITITGADQTGANQTYSLTSGDPNNLASGTPVIFTGDSNTSSMAWTIKFQYIPEADTTEVYIYCDLMIGMGPEAQYMTMSMTDPTVANILNNSPTWTDAMGGSSKPIVATYSAGGDSGGSSSGGGTNTDVIIISGAGSSEWNGTYTRSNEWGPWQVYYNGDNGKTLIFNYEGSDNTHYGMLGTSPPAYQSQSFSNINDLKHDSWYIAAVGASPAPTSTFGS